MLYKTAILVILVFTLSFLRIGLAEEPDDGNCGIIYGCNHSFSVCAPKGWVLDNKSGLPHGLHAVFYPLGSSWRNANVVMYMNWAVKDEVIKDIESLVKFNLSKFKENGSPNVEARFIRTLYTEKKKEGEIWEFTGDKWGNTEWVCYFEEQNGISMAVLTSKNISEFETSKKALIELSKSYFFITKDVKFN